MLRYCVTVLCVAFVTFSFAGIASAGYFLRPRRACAAKLLSGLSVRRQQQRGGHVAGISDAQHGAGAYLHTYLYTGGTAGTMNDITSNFTSATFTAAAPMNESGQMAVFGYGSSYGYSLQRRDQRDRHLI